MVPGAAEIRAMLRLKGWTNADLAAHWGHGITYVSWLVNNPGERPRVYDDAFRGLPLRSAVEVRREARHQRKKPARKWGAAEMYPIGRVFVTETSSLGPEEGTEMAVTAVQRQGKDYLVRFQLLTGDGAGEELELVHGESTDFLADTGQDRAQRFSCF